MELFFNLLWLALSTVLVTCWLCDRENWKNRSFRPTTQTQIVALLVLLVVLLPAVSLTDDLQACTTPVETEHVIRRVDLLPVASSSLHQAVMVVATLLSFERAASLQTLASVAPALEVEKPFTGNLRNAGNRPPPAT